MSEVVTFVWPAEGGRSGVVSLEWLKGRQVKHYLLDPRVRRYGVGALVTGSCRIYNSKKQRVRRHYVPEPGDTIVFIVAPQR